MPSEHLRDVVDEHAKLLEQGDFEGAARLFTEDALYSHPAFDGEDRQDEARGRHEIERLLREVRGKRDWEPRVHTFIPEDDIAIVEGDLFVEGEWARMFAAEVHIDEFGLISRLVAYWAPPIGDLLSAGNTRTSFSVDREVMTDTIRRYVDALERTDFDALRTVLSEDAVYSHPPYDPETTNERADAIGREAIIEMVARDRGERSWHHEIQRVVTRENRLFIVGVARDGEDGPVEYTYQGAGRFTRDGLLDRWIAYGSKPGAGATLGEL
ncbi:nuclear transport factor 2 family protein [Pedococcus sp. P5_B7]